MTLKDIWPPSMLRELSAEECLELLTLEPVGRVAWNTPHGPAVLPVNHVVRNGDILFRTSAHTAMARAMATGPVTFEADGYDAFHQSGWSVMVHGTATYVDTEDRDTDQPEPWAEGDRNLTVRVHPESVTGRRLIG